MRVLPQKRKRFQGPLGFLYLRASQPWTSRRRAQIGVPENVYIFGVLLVRANGHPKPAAADYRPKCLHFASRALAFRGPRKIKDFLGKYQCSQILRGAPRYIRRPRLCRKEERYPAQKHRPLLRYRFCFRRQALFLYVLRYRR